MSKYVVVKEYFDDTFTVEFFGKKEDAVEYAEHIKKLRAIKSVSIYEAID